MATRYVCKGGTATSWAAATSDSDPSTCVSMAWHNANAGSLSDGDIVMVSGRWGIIRTPLQTGHANITYLATQGGNISAGAKVSGFVNADATESLVDSYTTHDANIVECFYDHSTDSGGVSFTASKDFTLSTATLWLRRVGDVGSSEIWLELWSLDGSGLPLAKLAESDYLNTYSALAESPGATVAFTFSSLPSISNGSGYGLLINSDLDANWAGIYIMGHAEVSGFTALDETSGVWAKTTSSAHCEVYELSGGAGDVWYATQGADPGVVWMDGAKGTPQANQAALTANLDYWWDSGTNRLYLFCDSGDPDTVYTTRGVEYRSNSYALAPTSAGCTFDGLLLDRATYANVLADNPGSNCTLQNCILEWSRSGTELGTVSGTIAFSGWTIQGNIARYCQVTGIAFNYKGSDSVIRRNSCYEIDTQAYFEAGAGEDWNAGIKCFDDTGVMEGIEVYENLIFNCGNGRAGEYQGRGCGIWFDAVQPPTPTYNDIHHNCVHDTFGNGVFVEISSYTKVRYNVVWDCGTAEPHNSSEYTPAGIALDCRQALNCESNLVYNNTVYGGQIGIKLATYDQGVGRIRNNEVKNNIAVGASVHCLLAIYGGDNDTYGSGNVYSHNCFGAEAAGFLRWGATTCSTYDAYIAASSQADDNIEADPQLAAVGSDHYWLGAGSPCIGAGADLGASNEDGLDSTSVFPDAVVTRTQGAAWDLGAFVYSSGGSPPFTPSTGKRNHLLLLWG